jgi:GNAT superfamily N-acetyltransferase
MIEIKQIQAADTYPIRKAELRKNVSLSHKMSGDEDDGTLHLGLFNDGELLGIASFMSASNPAFKEKDQYQLRGMATAAKAQGRGYGKMLLEQAEDRLKEKGVEFVWCNARIVALDFYRKMDYDVQGSVFDIPEIGPHMRMYKRL